MRFLLLPALCAVSVSADNRAKKNQLTAFNRPLEAWNIKYKGRDFEDLQHEEPWIRLQGDIELKIDFNKSECVRTYKAVMPPTEKITLPGAEKEIGAKQIQEACGISDVSKYHEGCPWAYLKVPNRFRTKYGIRPSIQEYLKFCFVHKDSDPDADLGFRIMHEQAGVNYFVAYMDGEFDEDEVHPYRKNPMLQYKKNKLVVNAAKKPIYVADFKEEAAVCKKLSGADTSEKSENSSSSTYKPSRKRKPHFDDRDAASEAPATKKKKGVVRICYDTFYTSNRVESSALPIACMEVKRSELPKAKKGEEVTSSVIIEHLMKRKFCTSGSKSIFRKEGVCPDMKNGDKPDFSNWLLSGSFSAVERAADGSALEDCIVPQATDLDEQDQDVGPEGDVWRLIQFQDRETKISFHTGSYNKVETISTKLPVGSWSQAAVVVARAIEAARYQLQGGPQGPQRWIDHAYEAPFIYAFSALKSDNPPTALDYDEDNKDQYVGKRRGKNRELTIDYENDGGLYFGPAGRADPTAQGGNNRQSKPNLPWESFTAALIHPQQQFNGQQLDQESMRMQRNKFAQQAKKKKYCVPSKAPQAANPSGVQQVGGFQMPIGGNGWGW